MKTRNGFVSNSSSCSFIVSLKDHPNTISLAKEMIEQRYLNRTVYNSDEYEEDRYDMLKNNLNTIAANIQDHNLSPNLAFKSCNFDTFITQIEVGEAKTKYIYVATCNNEKWGIHKTIPKEPIYKHNKHNKHDFMATYEESQYFNEGDLYDSVWDRTYIRGDSFTCIDNLKVVKVENQLYALGEEK